MTTDIALYNDPFDGDVLAKAYELASKIAKTSIVPDVYRNKPDEVFSIMLVGREMGIGPMMALQRFHNIKGKVTQSAEMMRGAVQSAGHEIWTDDFTNTRVTLSGRRKGESNVVTVTWTLDDAKRAKLDGKDNWRAYPRSMLTARATGELCRLLFADVLMGAAYTTEEMEDGDVEFDAPSLVPVEPVKAAITRKAAPAKKSAAKRTATQVALMEPAEPPLPPLPGEEESDAALIAAAEGAEYGPDAGPPPDEAATQRAQAIAMRIPDDDTRHNLISAVTNGVKSSGKLVTAEEGEAVLLAHREILAGRKVLLVSPGGICKVADVVIDDATGETDIEIIDPDPADPEQDVINAHLWDGPKWKRYLSVKGVTREQALAAAKELCEADPDDLGAAPLNMTALEGRVSLCAFIVGWIEEHADPNAEF